MAMALSAETSALWDEFFIDPSNFWDNRHDKKSPTSPDFRHKRTKKPLWINGWHNPPCIKEKLTDLGFLDSVGGNTRNDEDEELRRVQFRDQIRVLNLIQLYGKEKNLNEVRRMHDEVLEKNLIVKDAYIATSLITTYGKCGSMDEARGVFEKLVERNVVAWSALISGYVQNELGDEALKCFIEMKNDGVAPNEVTYVCVLKACGIVGSLDVGENIDAEIRKQGLLHKNVVLGTALVDMYSKCGMLEKAREVFDELPERNVVSWNALISGYAQNGLGDEALKCFRHMQNVGVCPDARTYACVLKSCGIVRSLEIGEEINAEIRKEGLLWKDIVLGNALVDMYSKCGALEKAQEVFEQLPERNAGSWNALIAGYIQNGLCNEAVTCFKQMKNMEVCPDAITYIWILKACSLMGSLEIGEKIDAETRRKGLLEKHVRLSTALLDMYCKCGALEKAQTLFDELPERTVVTWSALITGYTQNGLGDEALKCFRQMSDTGIPPTEITYVSILKACGLVGSVVIGKEIDSEIRKKGLLQKSIMLGSALVDMYLKCGELENAQKVFDNLQERNLISWNAMISGYAQNGLGAEALKSFEQMQTDNISPDAVTYISILKACSLVGSLEIGEDIDAEIRKKGLLEKDVMLGNALVDMYSKCGVLDKAQEVFRELPVRDVISWTALITGYAQHGLGDEALKLFQEMKDVGVCPNVITYIYVLKACGIVGSLEIGEEIDAKIREQGLVEKNIMLGTALVDMYSKCGAMEKAQEVFAELPEQNIMSWNTLITGYAQSGQGNVALELYRRMRAGGVLPNLATFIGLLSACSHGGLVRDGEKFFDEMCVVYCLTPTLEHYICMIDLFGRAGYFDKAKAWLKKCPYSAHLRVFRSILGACRKWKNVEFGRWAFEQSIQLDEKCGAAYICMANIYAAAGMQREADGIEALMVYGGLSNWIGC